MTFFGEGTEGHYVPHTLRARALLAESRLENIRATLKEMTEELEATEYNSRDAWEDGANSQLRKDILNIEKAIT